MAVSWQELRDTPLFRKIIGVSLLVQLGSTLCFFIFFGWSVRTMGEANDKMIFTAAARLSEFSSYEMGELVSVFTQKATDREIELGQKLLAPYGYAEKSHLGIKPFGQIWIRRGILFFAIAVMISFLLHFLFIAGIIQRIGNEFDLVSRSLLDNLEKGPVFLSSEFEEGVIGLLRDRFNRLVNVLKSSLERLGREKIFLKESVSDISHQLKTPLASLIMYNDLLIDNRTTDEETKIDFLLTSRRQLNRMEWLIKSLLQAARLEADTIIFTRDIFFLNDEIEKWIQDWKRESGTRLFQYSDSRTELKKIKGDINWLGEALGNIVKNAIRYTDPNTGTISLALSDSPLFVRIKIKDNGPGIDNEDLPRIFERFYKGGNSADMESVGIGLYLSRKIVEGHNGDIRVESQPGEGASFIITLPY